MPLEKQPELGVKSPYDARYKMTTGEFAGVDKRHDASLVPDNKLREAINVRHRGGIAQGRFGQSLESDTGTGACVQGLVDVAGDGPRVLVAYAMDIDLFDRTIPSLVDSGLDLTLAPFFQSGSPSGLDFSGPRYAFLFWDGKVVFGSGTSFYKALTPELGTTVNDIQREVLFEMLVPGEFSPFEINNMVSLPKPGVNGGADPLYFGTMGGGVVGYADGELARLLAEGTLAGANIQRGLVFRYNGRLYAVGENLLFVQAGWQTGGSPVSTSWTAVALPGSLNNFGAMCATEWGGYGWIGGFDLDGSSPSPHGRILRVDDSSGTPVVTVAKDGTGGFDSFDDFAEAFDNLYVAWRGIPSATELSTVSQFDGTTVGPNLIPGVWVEDGMVVRIIGAGQVMFISAWGQGVPGPGPGPETAIYAVEGETGNFERLIKLSSSGDGPAPYDMVFY